MKLLLLAIVPTIEQVEECDILMKKFMLLITVSFMVLIVAACGNDNETGNNEEVHVTDPPEEYSSTEAENESIDDSGKSKVGYQDTEYRQQLISEDGTSINSDSIGPNNPNNHMKITNTPESNYPFTRFELEADIGDTKDAVEVDYEIDTDESEAFYKDKIQGIQLSGDEAMRELNSIFQAFEFDEHTSNEDVLNKVLEAFDIPKEAKNVELEIHYLGETEKEYKR